MTRDTRRLKAILVLVAALAFAAAPLFVTDFDGYDPGDFPVPLDEPPVQPSPYAFSIWIPIYIWLVAHGFFGLLARPEDPAWDATRWPAFVSLALGVSWLSVASVAPLTATLQIWAMLVFALVAAARAVPDHDGWLLAAPLSLYAGWLTAATWVSTGLVLGGYGIAGESLTEAIVLIGATVTALFAQSRAVASPIYALGVIWAFVAISVGNAVSDFALAVAAALGASAVAFVAVRRVS